MLSITIYKDILVRMNVRRVYDLLPIVRRIAPQRPFWVGLHSRSIVSRRARLKCVGRMFVEQKRVLREEKELRRKLVRVANYTT